MKKRGFRPAGCPVLKRALRSPFLAFLGPFWRVGAFFGWDLFFGGLAPLSGGFSGVWPHFLGVWGGSFRGPFPGPVPDPLFPGSAGQKVPGSRGWGGRVGWVGVCVCVPFFFRQMTDR